METIKYRVDNCLEQGRRIKKEYPTVAEIRFDLLDLDYFKLKEFADSTGRRISLTENDTVGVVGVLDSDSGTFVWLRTSKLIVESVIRMEE